MAKLPVRLNDKVTNSVHGDGLITTADPTVIFEGQPVACVGHSATFADSTTGVIQEGNACVTVNGKRIALLADNTSNSGVVAESATTIQVDEGTPFVHLGPNVFIGKNVSFNTLKSPVGKTKPPLMDVQLFHYDGCDQQEPIANAYYKLTSFAGPTFSGQLDANGRATVAQVPTVPYKVNFSSYDAAGTDSQHVEQLKQQLQQQRSELKSNLDQIISAIAAAEKSKQLVFEHASLCKKIFKLVAATGETGYHIVRDVVTGTVEIADDVAQTTIDLTNKMMDISVALGEAALGSTSPLKNDMAAIGQSTRETIQVTEEDTHTFWWLMRDHETWSMLDDFSHRYWQALSTQSKVEQIEYTVSMVAIVLITGGDALPGAASAAEKITQATKKLKALAKTIRQVDVAVEHIGETAQLEKMRPREIRVVAVTPIKPLTPELAEAFSGGASALMPEEAYNKFYVKGGKFGRLDGAFVTTKAAMDELLIRANGDINLIMKELGVTDWEGDIYRIDIDNPLDYNPRRVTKDMSGANVLHIEAADKTLGGQPEIAINQIPKVATNKNLRATKVITKEGVSLLPTPVSQPIIEPITQE